uniref:Uncharacterized protein n=1 Tax=Tanacetum cinerariifolium TaxID=118510 RepID=A0A6L2LCK0_TANCI|nr:hypothetical protein [Tanacetum cinerariifolium]
MKKESMSIYVTIEDVIEEEEGFVGKGGFGGEEDNIEDAIVVANGLCSSIIQTNLSVDFKEDINTKSHELMSFGKTIIIKLERDEVEVMLGWCHDLLALRHQHMSQEVVVNEPLVDGDVEDVGDLSMEAMEDEEVAMMNEVFEVTFGALSDETRFRSGSSSGYHRGNDG